MHLPYPTTDSTLTLLVEVAIFGVLYTTGLLLLRRDPKLRYERMSAKAESYAQRHGVKPLVVHTEN